MFPSQGAPASARPRPLVRSLAPLSASAAITPQNLEPLFSTDPQLEAHEQHLRYRSDQYLRTLESIVRNEGSLEDFANGHQRFGIHRRDGCTVYREWAPGAIGAQLIGDFNGWAGTWMEKDEYGVWTVTLPDGENTDDSAIGAPLRPFQRSARPINGPTLYSFTSIVGCKYNVGPLVSYLSLYVNHNNRFIHLFLCADPSGAPAIPHGSRVKVRLQHPGGWWVDRLPAWIKWATVEPGKMGAKYDGRHWDPPAGEQYQFHNARPKLEGTLRIYETHVGMSGEDETVASYTYFKGAKGSWYDGHTNCGSV